MTYRPNLPSPVATTTQAGVIKADGTSIVVAADATASVVGTTVTALTDISSGSLGGPAASDIDVINRAGNDYKVTLSARAAFFRKSPAGSRTITLASGATIAVLNASDNDRRVVVTGVAGALSADGTITDGFSCFVINKTGSALSYNGITGLNGATSVANGAVAQIYMAASSLEATLVGSGSPSTPATSTTLGTVKPDGVSLSASTDGTLSVITTNTHALPTGTTINSNDEIATYSSQISSDVKYSLNQISNFAQTNIQGWATSARPVLGAGRFGIGYNNTLDRLEFWNGAAWTQHIRISDISATSTQLIAGPGIGGTFGSVSVGAGLQLASGTLIATPITTPITLILTSGSSQTISFPASGNRAYDITLSANCNFSVTGGTTGELQTLTLVIRGGSGGFTVTLPSNVKWKGGSAPAVDTAAGSLNFLRIQTSDGGATYAGNF